MNKVLIFYISKHSGHFHAARAIERGLLEVMNGVDIKTINALEYAKPILSKIINRAYLEVIKNNPCFWGNIYDNPEVMKKTEKARKTLNKISMPKIKKLLEKFSPDIIFCTQAFPCSMVVDYKRLTGKDVKLVGVLTDYAPHSYWLFDEVDQYVAPSEGTAEKLIKKGVPPEKIKVLGIPVDPKFQKKKNKAGICRKLGIDPEKPSILIMGGNKGLGSVEEVVGSLLEDEVHSYQLMVVSGANKKLHSSLIKLKKNASSSTLIVFPYVENIDELMEVSDVIVTKAGGMTTSEAMVKNVPMLIVNPIPGHEDMNTEYLERNGAAVRAKDYTQVQHKLNELFASGGMLEDMRESIRGIAKPESALDIARIALEKIEGTI